MEELDTMIAVRTKEMQNMSALSPHRAAELSVELSTLLSSLNSKIVEKEALYNKLVLGYYQGQENLSQTQLQGKASVAAAELQGKASQEYLDWRKEECAGRSLLQMIRSLNRYVDLAREEAKGSSF